MDDEPGRREPYSPIALANGLRRASEPRTWLSSRNGVPAGVRTGSVAFLSSKSVSAHFALLRQLLADAVRDGILLDNPTTRVRAPKKSSRERRTYSIEQVIDLYGYLKPTRLAVPVLTKALTGLRRGELLALRWKNVDFRRGIAYVHESVTVDRHGTISFKPPKTDKSRRPVALPRALISILADHKHQQERERELLGLAAADWKRPFGIDPFSASRI